MEIFAKLGIDWKLFLFQVVNFSIILFVLHRFLYKPFLSILEQRKKRVEESMVQVKDIEQKHKEMEEKIKREFRHAQEKAKMTLDKAIEDAGKVKDDLVKKAQSEAIRLTEHAKKEINAEREKIMTEIKRDVGEMVVEVAGKVLKEEINQEKHERLIKESIA